MKPKTERSLLKWASLLSGQELRSIIDVENTSALIKLLNVLEPFTFRELQLLDHERSSNSIVSILKCVNSYYKKQLNCNVSSIIENLNIFKNPMTMWELLIGVAIKGRNRDVNINVILQMELEEQSELMLLVEDVIEKLNQYEVKKSLKGSQISSSSQQVSKRAQKESRLQNQYFNEIMEQNEALKQKIVQLQAQMTQQKIVHEQAKKNYQQRLNTFKNQRYQFLQALTGGFNSIENAVRSRKGSQFNFRDSIHQSNDSKIYDDPLNDLNVSITGTLPQIATDLLNAIKNLKKQLVIYQQKSTLFEDHLKDLKTSYNSVFQENKLLKSQIQKAIKLQKQFDKLKEENQQLLNNQTEMIKIIKQVQEQKSYLRQMVDKLKEQKNQLVLNFQQKKQVNGQAINKENQQDFSKGTQGTNNMLEVNFKGSNEKFDIMRAPSMILRQMGSQLEPQSYNLNQQINEIKNPIIQQKYEKQLSELREKNNTLKKQNNELKQVNKMLQKTVHRSMQKSEEIQKNIEEGYKALFGVKNEIEQSEERDKNKNKLKLQQHATPQIVIRISDEKSLKSKIYESKEHTKKQNDESQRMQRDNRMVQFYNQVKKIVEAYEQKEMLMMIEIESLKKQLNDLVDEKVEYLENQEKDLKKDKKEPQNVMVQSKNQRREMKIKQNVVQERVKQQEKELKIIKERGSSELSIDKMDEEQDDDQICNQQEKGQKKKEQSMLMFNINISGPGGDMERTPTSQQYQVKRSAVDNQNNQSTNQYQNNKINIIQPKTPQHRNKETYPSEEFIQIQQGEQFNEGDLPFVRKSHENSQESDKGDKIIEEDEDRHSMLHLDFIQRQKRLSTVSGIGLGFSRYEKKSFFSKSGFYNESFLELSGKLQAEIQMDVNEIGNELKQKRVRFNMSTVQLGPSEEQQCEDKSVKQLGEDWQAENKELVEKLERISKSYERIKQFHVKSSQELQSQLKQQLNVEQSQLAQLKVNNEQLKLTLTKILREKELLAHKVKQIRALMKAAQTDTQNSQSVGKIMHALEDISELQKIMPELELSLQQSKIRQIQTLYLKQKLQKEHLQQEIQLLLQTVVYFRNLAICQEEDIL